MAIKKITDEQIIAERKAGLTLKQISEKYGISRRQVEFRHSKLVKRGLSHGRDYVGFVPDGYMVKGVSTLIGSNGEIKQSWLKTDQDKDRQIKLMQMAIEALCADIVPVEPKKYNSAFKNIIGADLMNLYTISDYHLGMLAWGEETGDDWDMTIAKDLFYKWFCSAIALAPAAKCGTLNILGDFAHFDSLDAVTPASGHVLDADTRYQKLVRYMIEMIRNAIEMLLEKHEEVRIIIAQGNHDETGMIWLAEMMNVLYCNEPRVFVDTSPDVYKATEWGKTSIFFHHGHKAKFDQLESVMISRFRELFGRTEYSYAHIGHLHHQKMVESRNMVVEQHRTLAAKDAYAARGGWFSKRSANVITYSKEYGEISRLTISPEMTK